MIQFLRKDKVLSIAMIGAILTAFIIPPSANYIKYIDYRVLALLFCLMLVVSGFQSIGLFEVMIQRMFKHVNTARKLAFILVFVCFFTSMLITNDVALITFVPFAIIALQMAKQENNLIWIVVLQTVAANLGSMLTPIGNPQNIYLYTISEMSIVAFLKVMAPITCISFLLILTSILFMKDEKIEMEQIHNVKLGDKRKLIMYIVLFLVCLAVVTRIVHYLVAFIVVTLGVLFIDRKIFKKVDYALLGTFVALFLFIGNMGEIPIIRDMLEYMINGRETLLSVLLSQVISNVPAALLLSNFTMNYKELLIGVNIGGLGTIIASMASIISYRLYAKTESANKGKYLCVFTVVNLAYLLILYGAISILA